VAFQGLRKRAGAFLKERENDGRDVERRSDADVRRGKMRLSGIKI